MRRLRQKLRVKMTKSVGFSKTWERREATENSLMRESHVKCVADLTNMRGKKSHPQYSEKNVLKMKLNWNFKTLRVGRREWWPLLQIRKDKRMRYSSDLAPNSPAAQKKRVGTSTKVPFWLAPCLTSSLGPRSKMALDRVKTKCTACFAG